jgi:hypothetical protein
MCTSGSLLDFHTVCFVRPMPLGLPVRRMLAFVCFPDLFTSFHKTNPRSKPNPSSKIFTTQQVVFKSIYMVNNFLKMPYDKVMLRVARMYAPNFERLASNMPATKLDQNDINAIANRVVTSIEHDAAMHFRRFFAAALFWVFIFFMARGFFRACCRTCRYRRGEMVFVQECDDSSHTDQKNLEDKSYPTRIPTNLGAI